LEAFRLVEAFRLFEGQAMIVNIAQPGWSVDEESVADTIAKLLKKSGPLEAI
jgi:hypothetical protein